MGQRAWFICDKSGFRYRYSERVKESTGYVVGPPEADGMYNLKDHPQNKSPKITAIQPLRDARPDVVLATTGDASWTPDMTVPRCP